MNKSSSTFGSGHIHPINIRLGMTHVRCCLVLTSIRLMPVVVQLRMFKLHCTIGTANVFMADILVCEFKSVFNSRHTHACSILVLIFSSCVYASFHIFRWFLGIYNLLLYLCLLSKLKHQGDHTKTIPSHNRAIRKPSMF